MNMTASSDGSRVYILSYLYGSLISIDDNTGKQIWKVKVGAKPRGLVLRGETAYVNSRSGIVKVSLEDVQP
jgi:outer membrane protein assembly factor BamB